MFEKNKQIMSKKKKREKNINIQIMKKGKEKKINIQIMYCSLNDTSTFSFFSAKTTAVIFENNISVAL